MVKVGCQCDKLQIKISSYLKLSILVETTARFFGFVNVLPVNLATTLKFNKILVLRNTMTGLFYLPQKITHNNIIKPIIFIASHRISSVENNSVSIYNFLMLRIYIFFFFINKSKCNELFSPKSQKLIKNKMYSLPN